MVGNDLRGRAKMKSNLPETKRKSKNKFLFTKFVTTEKLNNAPKSILSEFLNLTFVVYKFTL